MTRGDYSLLAAIAKEAKGNLCFTESGFAKYLILTCERLKADNPRFNPERFLHACGYYD